MGYSEDTPPIPGEGKKTVWAENRPGKEDGAYYEAQRTKYEEWIKRNKFLIIPEQSEQSPC